MILDQDIASMLLKKLLGSFPLDPENNLYGKGDDKYFKLNSVLTEIFLEVSEWSHLPTDLSNRYLEFIENTLLGKITRSIRLRKDIHEKTLLALLPFLPKLILRVDRDWRDNLLEAFTITFSDCKPESKLKLACISTVRDMIIPNGDILYPNASDPTVHYYQVAWVNKLPSLLNQLGNEHPVSTQVLTHDIQFIFNPVILDHSRQKKIFSTWTLFWSNKITSPFLIYTYFEINFRLCCNSYSTLGELGV
jgi:pre-rRNA-processing protein IPI1